MKLGALALLGLAAAFVPDASAAQDPAPVHALALHGEPKYGPDFRHFAYVNPTAPKGGTLRLGSIGTYDSFNPWIIKGTPAYGSSIETLLKTSADEPFTAYGLLAESLEVPPDRSWVIFNLRPQARWHDGRPITADDVVFSFETLKAKGHPRYRLFYREIVETVKLDERRVRFSFSVAGNRELPLMAGDMPILPKHFWEARDFTRTLLEPDLGSGPYRLAEFDTGRYIVLERVADYWGKDLPVNAGQANFDRIRTDFFRDAILLRQAFRSGLVDYRHENQAKAWALDYDIPAVRQGLMRLKAFPNERPNGMQGFVMNTRRPPLDDRRVRQALGYAFDFEWANRALFFGQYARSTSYFANSELAARGLPDGKELELLEPYRGRVPPEVFTQEYRPPATSGDGWPRENLRAAFGLLEEAGWVIQDMRLVNAATGRPMALEFLIVQKEFERILLPFKRNLERLGIELSIRHVDQAQYINRTRSFDYDMMVDSWAQGPSPGNEQRDYWSSRAADTPGSYNSPGIRDPVVDELVEKIVSAPDRPALVTATRALDRVLLWGHYVIPNWHSRVDRIVYWDRFGFPEVVPAKGTHISYWWFEPAKAARVVAALASGAAGESGGNGSRLSLAAYAGAAAGLVVAGYFVMRRAMRKGGHALCNRP